MTEEDPDLLADDGDHDQSRSRSPFPAMSERFRLTEELENARYQNNLLVQKCRELEERIDAIKYEVEAKEKINATLTSAFGALRRERDEARWEVCGFHHLTGFLAGDYAISRGWNYFNDEGKWAEFPKSVTDFKEFLNAHSEEDRKTIERLREENRQLRENKN